MNRKARLEATLRGDAVDRPPISFYELNGLDEVVDDQDRYNIYSHPSWRNVLDLARNRSDRIVMRTIPATRTGDFSEKIINETWFVGNQKYTKITIPTKQKKLTAVSRRDPDVNTTWQIEHLLKDVDDLVAYLDLPEDDFTGELDVSSVREAEQQLGDSGIVMLDTPDPICIAASLFDLGTFTVLATQEPDLFHKLLQRFYRELIIYIEMVSNALPGYLWRIYGPEYASPPYLHPRFFPEYITQYDKPMVEIIQKSMGYARIHCHGKVSKILDEIMGMGIDGLDPIEPPPQGDVELIDVCQRYGDQVVLFGNLEASDLESLPKIEFSMKIRKALREGTSKNGRGFVLMPSSCPYGRNLNDQVYENYLSMVEIVENGDY